MVQTFHSSGLGVAIRQTDRSPALVSNRWSRKKLGNSAAPAMAAMSQQSPKAPELDAELQAIPARGMNLTLMAGQEEHR